MRSVSIGLSLAAHFFRSLPVNRAVWKPQLVNRCFAALFWFSVVTSASATVSLSLTYSGTFPTVNPNATVPSNRADVPITVTNNGDEPASIFSYAFEHPAATFYSIVGSTCPNPIAVGANCALTIRFTAPVNTPNQWAYDTLYVGAYGAPYLFQASLSGLFNTPPGTLTVQTANTTFGTQPFGVASTAQTIVLKNTGSTIVTADPATTSNTNFVVDPNSNSCNGTVPPGAECQLTVTFIPSATGTLNTSITVPHNGTGSVVNVSGTGAGEQGLVFGGGGTTSSGGTGVGDKNVGGAANPNQAMVDAEQCEGGGAPPCPPIDVIAGKIKLPANGAMGGGAGGSEFGISSVLTEPPSPRVDPCDRTSSIEAESNTMLAYNNPAGDIGTNVDAADYLMFGDPIHSGLGNKSHPQTDYSTRSGFVLAFRRTYQAQAPDASSSVRQKLGPGWYSIWDRSVSYVAGSANKVRVTRGDGSSYVFDKQADGTWKTDADITDTLAGSGGISWAYKSGDNTETYDGSGVFTALTLSTGEQYTLTYTSNRLSQVTDPSGRHLTFAYDTKGRLSTLTDPSGGVTTYAYDPDSNAAQDRLDRLVSVTFPDGRARRYKYQDPTRKFALTSIATYEGGVENTYVTFSYDGTNGRAIGNFFGNTSNEASGTGRIKVSYSADGSSVSYDSSAVTRYGPTDQQPASCPAQYLDASSNAKYCLNVSGTYPSNATVKRTFTTIQGRVLPTRVDYMHICAACANLFETFAYDTNGFVTSQTDRGGVTTTTTYTNDGRGLVASTTQAAGTGLMRTRTTTWHASFNVPLVITEPTGIASAPTRTTTYTYDGAGRRLTETVATAGQTARTTTYTYNVQGRLASVDGPRSDVNDVTTYTYDANGNVYQMTNPKGQTTTYASYDAHGNPTLIYNPDGTGVQKDYDARGRLWRTTANGIVQINTYTTNGLLASSTDGYGGTTSYLYDSALRLTGKNLSNGEKLRYTLDNAGRTIMTETFDAEDQPATKSSVVYDGLNRVLQRIDANGKVTNYSYDANGNVTSVTDPNNFTTTTQYDVLNRPILVTDPNLKTVATNYLANDKVASIQDPNNNTTTYAYNGFGEQTQIQSPDTATTNMTYNAAGLVQIKVDSRGKTTSYAYDALGRVTSVVFADGYALTHTYDVATNGVGRLASVADLSGTTAYTYDAYGRVATKTTYINGAPGGAKTITYARDGSGRLTSITYPSGSVLGMSYTESRITNMTLNGSALISAIEYFPLGGPESWLLGANVAGVKDYTRWIDSDSRIQKYSTPTGYRGLTFDNAGRIAQIGDYIGTVNATLSGTQSFGYDNVGRLTSFSGFTSNGNGQASINQTQSFTYDSNGNRLTSVLNGVTSTYTYQTGNNRLAMVSGGLVRSNVYDNAGNLTADGSSTYTYDARGRMTVATKSGVATNFLVNFQNLRVRKWNATTNASYIYDDAGHMLAEYDAAGSLVQELFWMGETPIAVRGTMPCLTGGGCAEMAVAYVWADHLNTPRELTRVNASNQHVSLWKWDSLPFGETAPNQNPSNLGIMNFNHRFPGQYFDKETGLHQNWHREYDPRLGRYITSDPLGLAAGTNTFAYADGRPIIRTDMTGLDPGGTPGGMFCMAACQPDPQAYAYSMRVTLGFEHTEMRNIENFFEGFQNTQSRLGTLLGQVAVVCYQALKPLLKALGESETGFSSAAMQAGLLGVQLAGAGATLSDLRSAGGCSCGGR